jgi:hypothetical protein
MQLKQTFEEPISGFWDGGKKQVFLWSIDGVPQKDNKGYFVRIGSWAANFWFSVAIGKTERLTLSYAKSRLKTMARGKRYKFKYVE